VTGLSITISIDLSDGMDEAKMRAVLDGLASLQTRLQLADRGRELHQQQRNDDATFATLVDEHRAMARAIAARYYAPGLDRGDLEQEALIGLQKAARDYDGSLGSSFKAFASLCIERHVMTAVKTATRQKHEPLNHGARLEQPLSEDADAGTLGDVVADTSAREPAEILITKEELEHLSDIVQERLTELERRCLMMVADGIRYKQIASTLGETEKSVDNALQRARRKLSEPIENGDGALAPKAEQVTLEPARPESPPDAAAKASVRSRTAPRVLVDGVPCKVDGCTEQGPRMGAWAKLCPTHVDHICNGGRVTIDGLEYRRKQPRGLQRVYTADEIPVDQAAIAERLNAPLVKCPYCQEKRSQRHVDQHTQEVERERARQEAERAKVAHLARPSGVGGAA
jgi:RNA polymerase sporulation-specific sigma factor